MLKGKYLECEIKSFILSPFSSSKSEVQKQSPVVREEFVRSITSVVAFADIIFLTSHRRLLFLSTFLLFEEER